MRSTRPTGAVWESTGSQHPGVPVTRFIDELIEIHGKPTVIRCDNGPELTSQAFTDWARARAIDIRYIQPGKPDQNTFIERFNRSYREEVLSAHLFESIADVQEITDD
jgi:putative transposase